MDSWLAAGNIRDVVWAHTRTRAEALRQPYGPIQDCWQHLLDSCVGAYNANSSTPQAAMGPYRTAGNML
jgi:hypothetical protein